MPAAGAPATMISGDPTDAPPARVTEAVPEDPPENRRTQRRALAAVWLAAGSALAAMIGVGWYAVVRNGGYPPGGDMTGHAATAEWLRTLPWWDWRGWSDWFFGGQAIGVNYPPLGHALLRFTHPAHGQMAAVAVGLLVLLPWGTLRLARAVGCSPRAQRGAVGAVLVLAAASGNMHWILSGFHSTRTLFGSWPAMLATVLGLFCAACAARCDAPLACGVAAGLAVLFNSTVVPGVAVICLALLITSGATLRTAGCWAASASAAALAVCSWWLVPFVAGWDRLVRFEVPLREAWAAGGVWQAAVLTGLGVSVAWAGRHTAGPARRLALAAGAGLLVTLLADLLGYLRAERWLQLPVLVAAVAIGAMLASRRHQGQESSGGVRPTWALLGAALVIILVVITVRLEVLPLAAWLLLGPRRTWAAAGALAWACILIWVPLWAQIREPDPSEPPPAAPLELAAAHGSPGARGLVHLSGSYSSSGGEVERCPWGFPWRTTTETAGLVRPLSGLYRETSHAAEFVFTDLDERLGAPRNSAWPRPHWLDAWRAAGSPSLGRIRAAEAFGARWYASCDEEGQVVLSDLSSPAATGVTVVAHPAADVWHRAAVEWWMSVNSGDWNSDSDAVPVFSHGESAAHSVDQAARNVSLHAGDDTLMIHAETAGWAWVRVPWDPDWRSVDGTPVRRGGPGHLVVWANQGPTELRWSVRRSVDVAAVVITGAGAFVAIALALRTRRDHRRIEFEGVPRRGEAERSSGPDPIGDAP